MNTPTIGSFGAILGGGSPIAQAMARQGMDGSILNQVSPASANFQPMPGQTQPTNNALPLQQPNPAILMALRQALAQQPTQAPLVAPAGAPAAPTAPVAAPNAAAAPVSAPETELILKALTERLKHHSNVEKQLLGG